MLVQPFLRSFSTRCYACHRQVNINTRAWEVDAKYHVVDYWGACPSCAAEIFEFTALLPRKECLVPLPEASGLDDLEV